MKNTLILCLILFAGCSHKNKGPLVEEFRQISLQAKTENQACSAFTEKSRVLAEVGKGQVVHASKDEALRALALLEQRPALPNAIRGQKVYQEKFEELANLPNQKEIVELRLNLNCVCGSFVAASHIPLLIADAKKYAFTPEEKKRVEAVTKAAIDEGHEVNIGIIYRALQLVVLKEYLKIEKPSEKKLIEEAGSVVDYMEAERRKMTKTYEDALKQYRGPTIRAFAYEESVAQKMTERHAALVKKVFP